MAASKDKEFEVFDEMTLIENGSANSKAYSSAKPLTTYYRKLKDFNYYSGPKEISDKLAEIRKNIKNIKSKMEELSGSTVLYETDVVDNLSTIVDDTKNYVDDALTPATKKIKGLKTDLEEYYKNTTSSLASRTGSDKNVVVENFDYNENFKNYLSTEGRKLTSMERKIYQEISDIQSASSYSFRLGSGPVGSLYPLDPIVAVPEYGVEPIFIKPTPKYGVELPVEITAVPMYGVQIPPEVYSAPSYGVIPTTTVHATPKYGVELPTEVYSAPSYGVIPTTTVHATPKYGVELPTEITAIPDYGVQLPITGIHATPKYGVELPTEITAIPDYGVQLPITGIHATPKYGVELPTEIYAIPDYGVKLPKEEIYAVPDYGVQLPKKKNN